MEWMRLGACNGEVSQGIMAAEADVPSSEVAQVPAPADENETKGFEN